MVEDGLVAVTVGARGMTAAEVQLVSRERVTVALAPEALQRMAASRALVDNLAASDAPVYGISTGFGALAGRHIGVLERTVLQRSLIRSHAAGMGEPVEAEVVRAMLVLRLRTLATGHTGVRPEVAAAMAGLLNAGISPLVREHGSLGCSGDLAPLAQCALTLLGEGQARDAHGRTATAADLLAAAGLPTLELHAKEGLALINGTDGMLGMLVLACADIGALLTLADVTAAMSVEVLLGTDQAFLAELQALRPHQGQAHSAANMLAVLAGSGIVASHRLGDTRVQDAYSLRCAPAVAGAARDTLRHARLVADVELVSAIDNPVVLDDGRVLSNGNFHGAPLAHVLDFLAISLADVGAMAERRTDRMLDPARSRGLPPFLAADPGVDSGLMIAHYTQAALVAENKRLAGPASIDSIPTSAMQEDHVSMGWAAARKLRRSVANLAGILAVELLTAARALDLRAPLIGSPATRAARDVLRQTVLGPGSDRHLDPELAAATALVRSPACKDAVEAVTGPLH